mmetsp:Transcript_37439/g.93122  ORF Transcript_37439/g.93122 Transcript_37439/m.93122 type:complete len:116 (+) Transcript_37439:98-445(+)
MGGLWWVVLLVIAVLSAGGYFFAKEFSKYCTPSGGPILNMGGRGDAGGAQGATALLAGGAASSSSAVEGVSGTVASQGDIETAPAPAVVSKEDDFSKEAAGAHDAEPAGGAPPMI